MCAVRSVPDFPQSIELECFNKFLTDRSGLLIPASTTIHAVTRFGRGDQMSFTMLAAAILGCDVLLYALFAVLYPERRKGRSAHANRAAVVTRHTSA